MILIFSDNLALNLRRALIFTWPFVQHAKLVHLKSFARLRLHTILDESMTIPWFQGSRRVNMTILHATCPYHPKNSCITISILQYTATFSGMIIVKNVYIILRQIADDLLRWSCQAEANEFAWAWSTSLKYRYITVNTRLLPVSKAVSGSHRQYIRYKVTVNQIITKTVNDVVVGNYHITMIYLPLTSATSTGPSTVACAIW